MKTSRSLNSFSLIEVVMVCALVLALLVTGGWTVITHLRLGSHQASTVVALGNVQTLFSQLERDIREARARGEVPLLLDEKMLKNIDFPEGPIELAELPKPIYQLVTTYPEASDERSSGLFVKKWTKLSTLWIHNRWPDKFRHADDDLKPFDEPDLEYVAGSYYPSYEETFNFVQWPKQQPKRVYFAIYRRNGFAVYTHYLEASDTRAAGSIWRYAPEDGVSCVVNHGIQLFEATPSFEFTAHPGNDKVGMELVKSAVSLAVTIAEADPGNAIAARPLTLSRRVYPPWLQSAPYRTRWVAH